MANGHDDVNTDASYPEDEIPKQDQVEWEEVGGPHPHRQRYHHTADEEIPRSEDEDKVTRMFGEGGLFEGLDIEDPQAWVRLKQVDESLRGEARERLKRAYEKRQEAEAAKRKAAGQAAEATTRIHQGLLREEHPDFHSKRLLGLRDSLEASIPAKQARLGAQGVARPRRGQQASPHQVTAKELVEALDCRQKLQEDIEGLKVERAKEQAAFKAKQSRPGDYMLRVNKAAHQGITVQQLDAHEERRHKSILNQWDQRINDLENKQLKQVNTQITYLSKATRVKQKPSTSSGVPRIEGAPPAYDEIGLTPVEMHRLKRLYRKGGIITPGGGDTRPRSPEQLHALMKQKLSRRDYLEYREYIRRVKSMQPGKDAPGKREPILEIPTPDAVKRDVRIHEKLRKRMLQGKATPEEENQFWWLHDKLGKLDLIVDPGTKRAKSPQELDQQKIDEYLKEKYSHVGPHGIRPPDETIESTIAQYGQEDISKSDLPGIRSYPDETHQSLAHGYIKTRQGWTPAATIQTHTHKRLSVPGWEATTKFNTEQWKRKYNALKTGEASLGWGQLGSGNYNMGVVPEKAKVTIGPNQEIVAKTGIWEPVAPPKDSAKISDLRNQLKAVDEFSPAGKELKARLSAEMNPLERGQDKFTVKVTRAQREKGFTATGDYASTGEYVENTVRSLGMGLSVKPAGDGTYVITTDEGKHLNPSEIDRVKQELHLNHNLVGFKSENTIEFRQKKALVPVGYHKLPKDIDEKDIVSGTRRRDIYHSTVGVKFGERDPITHKLLPGQKESVGIRVPGIPKVGIGSRAIQHHFNESTDAIGWGTSWRPGNTEVSNTLLAVPRFRQNKELAAAYDDMMNPDSPDDTKMNAYISKYHPLDETEGEIKERKNRLKKEGAELISAGTLAGYYSAKKNWPTRTVNRVDAGLRRFSPYETATSKWGRQQAQYGGGLIKDVDYAMRRPMSNMFQRAAFKVQNPLKTGRWVSHVDEGGEKVVQDFVEDPTTSGLMFHTQFKPQLPSWHYRKLGISAQQREGRKLEQQIEKLKGVMATRSRVQGVLSGEIKANSVSRKLAYFQAKTMLHDWYRQSTDNWTHQLRGLQTRLEGELKTMKVHQTGEKIWNEKLGKMVPKIEKRFAEVDVGGIHPIDEVPKYKQYVEDTLKETKRLLGRAGQRPELYSHEGLEKAILDFQAQHPEVLPKALRTAGKATVIGGAGIAVGTGAVLLGVDRYQTYKHNKGEDINHPILKAIIPETISVPKIKVKRTKEYTIPNNAFTDALDFQGEKVPTAGRISLIKEQKARLREHKDVSQEKYKSNLPLFGGIGLSAPAPVKGSMKKAVTHESSPSEFGAPKNMYVLGKKVPVDISVGKKERWDNRRHKLRSKYNPYKLSQDDREHLTQLASTSPEARERIESFYHGDEKLEEMLTDTRERDRIMRKNAYWLEGGKNKAAVRSYDETSQGWSDVSMKDSNQTLEQGRGARRFDDTRKRDYRQSEAERKRNQRAG